MKIRIRIETLLYWATVLLMLVGALIPEWRLWGLNLWAYFPTEGIAAVFAVALLLPFGLDRIPQPAETATDRPGSNYFMYAAGVLVVLGAAMLFGRVAIHFHGDGYQLLSMLDATGYPYKSWDQGTGRIMEAVHAITGGSALTSYRIVSIGSGLLVTVTLLLAAGKLFRTTAARLLFAFGVMTSGGSLLFFGYVENYAVLALMVILFALLGLLHIARGLSRWWLLLPAAGAVLSHVFGVVVIPALVYLLVYDLPVVQRLAARPRRTKALIALIALIVAGVGLAVIYRNSIFLQIALVPPVALMFTAGGYTLLSLPHLVDYINLLFLLLPGLAVLIGILMVVPARAGKANTERTLLWLLALSGLLIAFVVDPKLGMPRDWDLFAFAGLLLALLCFRRVGAAWENGRVSMKPLLLAIALGVLALVARVTAAHMTSVSVARLESYMELDPARHRNTYRVLSDYYHSIDQHDKAMAADTALEHTYPERQTLRQAAELGRAGRTDQALILLQRARQKCPNWADVYFNIGYTFLMMNQPDSALPYLRICDALNPNNALTANAFGIAWHRKSEYDRAIEYYELALQRDPTMTSTWVTLADIGLRTNDLELTRRTLARAAAQERGNANDMLVFANKLARLGHLQLAAEALAIAEQYGLDSAESRALLEQYPGLDNLNKK